MQFGVSAGALGDFNGDGFVDVVVGASRDASYGRVYIINLQTDLIVMEEECDGGMRCENDPGLRDCSTDIDCIIGT